MNKLFLRILLPLALVVATGMASFAQTARVSGTIKDAGGEPVIGASVMVKGTTRGTIANNDGTYTLEANPGDVLVCSCIGYTEKTATCGKSSVINFVLEEDSQLLDATVVVGYGTLKKSQLVGSVENISGEVLEDRVNANVARSLQGEVPGLTIIQNDGKPTHGGEIYIRGGATSYVSKSSKKESHSIGQGGGALVLIDGVEGDLSTVNPEDVENISVLKDASSSVIYGARAAYGVILVTTKSGKQDKVTVSYNGSVSLNQRSILWEDNINTDGYNYVKTFYDFHLGNTELPGQEGTRPDKINIYKIPTDYLERYEAFMASGEGPKTEVWNGSYLYYGYNENYLADFYKRMNMTTTHNVSVNGTAGPVSFAVSGRYYMQDGIYKIGKEKYDSYNLRSKIKVQIRKWLSLDNNTSFNKMNYIQPIFSKKTDNGVGSQLRQIAMAGFPIIPLRNDDGTYTVGAAAGAYAAFNDGNSAQNDDRFNLVSSTGITVEPVKDVFKIRGEFAYNMTQRTLERYVAPVYYSTAPGAMTSYVSQEDSYKKRNGYKSSQITANIVATYTPKLGDNHNLNLVAGWNLEHYNYEDMGILRKGMLYDNQPNFELYSGSEVELTQPKRSYGLVGFFARANYTALRRYIIEVSARCDGSSKFPVQQKWGFFPSASLGWRISEEPWMKASRNWLDNLKIRANAGALGNGAISPYAFLSTMRVSKSDTVFDGGQVSVVGDPNVIPDNLTWEKVITYDVGLDLDVLKSRLSFSGDLYIRDTKDLYINGPEIPATYGASSPKGNYGSLRTTGWELTLSWRDQFNAGGKPFSYSIKGSVWDSRTWVTQYYNQSGDIYNYYVGKELGEIWGFRTDGFFASNSEAAAWYPDEFHQKYPIAGTGRYAGDLKFLDKDGNRRITAGAETLDNHGDLERIGNEMPRYQYGLNVDMKWNGIGLSLFFQGVGKRNWYPSRGTDFFWGAYERAYVAYVLNDQNPGNTVQIDKSTDEWVVTNMDANPYWGRRVFGPGENAKGAYTFCNDHFIQNIAYIRLKNLTIDYSLPEKVLRNTGLSQVRFYLSGENLFTWSPMFKHTSMFDPEVIGNGDTDFHSGTSDTMGDGYGYPMLRTYTFGINLTF